MQVAAVTVKTRFMAITNHLEEESCECRRCLKKYETFLKILLLPQLLLPPPLLVLLRVQAQKQLERD
jgi:hypothetical protein